MSEDREDPFGRKDDPPSPFGDAPSQHDWLPPGGQEPAAAPQQPAPESPAGWQPPGAAPPAEGGWSPQPPAGPAYVQPQSSGGNGKATAALVLGIVGVVFCPLVCSILALVFGYQARKEIDTTGVGQGSRGSATAGIVLGWIGVALGVLGIGLLILLAALGELDEETDPGFNDEFDDFSTIRLVVGVVARAAVVVAG